MDRTARPMVAVVDDDLAVCQAMESLLRCLGLGVESFASAEEFLVSGQLSRMNCLILDVKMPGMSGLMLRSLLSKINPRLPTIFLTAHWDEAGRRQAMEQGAVEFLRKPCSDAELLEAVQTALATNRPNPRG